MPEQPAIKSDESYTNETSKQPFVSENVFVGWSPTHDIKDQNNNLQVTTHPLNDIAVHPTATILHDQPPADSASEFTLSSMSNASVTTAQVSASQPSKSPTIEPKRKSSIQLGNQIMSEIMDKDNVRNAIQILQNAMTHLDFTHEEDVQNKEQVSEVYSKVLKQLSDPVISKLVEEMTSSYESKSSNIKDSIIWRLFTKVIESGYVLQTDSHLDVIRYLVDRDCKIVATEAMYTLPRKEWDTACYQTAISLHLMQHPQQIQKAQGLLCDYGKHHLEIANPIAPTDLPPTRIEMPLMENITEQDQFKLWLFYQAAQSAKDDEWNLIQTEYETNREENMARLKQEKKKEKEGPVKSWAMEQLNIESKQQEIDRLSTENDNTMIYVALKSKQFEYGWQVYKAMGNAVNDATPCIAMHLCWVAARNIPFADISNRTEWENRAWSVYSRFMCSEYLHPEQPEAPGFLRDILFIAANTPEAMSDKMARYTKTMSVYQLLVRLHFDKLLCDNRVLEPVICTLLYECHGSPTRIVSMCDKAFEIWKRKLDILNGTSYGPPAYSMLWGMMILCLKAGNKSYFKMVIDVALSGGEDLRIYSSHDMPASLIAPVQAFHDTYLCGDSNHCYFQNYMFKFIEYTDDDQGKEACQKALTNIYGLTLESANNHPLHSNEYEICQSNGFTWRTDIDEPQANNIAMSVISGAAKQEKLVQKEMYYSTKKAKALLRHCSKKT